MVNYVMAPLLLGLLATTSPCVLPLYPGFIGYLSGQAGAGAGRHTYFLGFFVLAGVLSTMLALGALIAALAVSIGRILVYIIPVTDVVILLLGASLLLGWNPFKAIPQMHAPVLRRPLLSAYIYGLVYGPLTLPCSGPLVVSIFALSLTLGEALNTLWVFLWFGVGFGVPLFVLSLLSAAFQHRLTLLFARESRLINGMSGLIIIGTAIYDIVQNWELLRLFL